MSRPRNLSRAAAVAAALLAPSYAIAQQSDTERAIQILEQEAGEDGLFRFDFNIPSSPSLNLLGQAEDKVTVVNGLKPFILQLPALLGNGEDGQSLGLDISPTWLLDDPSERTYTRYRDGSRLDRILYRTHIGAALYEGADNDDPAAAQASRVTLGLSTSLLDYNDPLMASLPGENRSVWQSCLDGQGAQIARDWGNVQSPPNPEAAQLDREIADLNRELSQLGPAEQSRREEIRSRITEKMRRRDEITATAMTQAQAAFARTRSASVFTDCARDANLVARYGASLGIGVGALWNGDPGRLENFRSGGWVIWTAYRQPLGIRFQRDDQGRLEPSNYWMIGLSGRIGLDEILATNDAAVPQVQANVFDGWAGLEYLGPASRLAFQLGYQVRDTEGRLPGFDRERLRYFVSFSQRLGGERSAVWIRAGYGHAQTNGDDDAAFTLSIVFAPPSAANLFGTAD